MWPEMTLTAPNSPSARAVVRTTPYAIAHRIAGKRHAPERLPARSAERRGRLLLIGADLAEHRDDLADDERQRNEDRDEDHPGQREHHLDSVVGQPAPEPAGPAVQEQEREPDDDRRQREREVDEGVHDALAGEALAHDRERADHAEDRVRRHRDRGDQHRQVEGVLRLGRRDRGPGRAEPVLERAVEDEPDRARQHHQQVAEPDDAQRPSTHGRASSPSAGARRSRAAPRT